MGEEFFSGVLRLCPVDNFIVFRTRNFYCWGFKRVSINYKNCIVLYKNYFVLGFSKEMVVKSPQGQISLLLGVFFVHGDEE